jgi:hypothetical protein
VSAPVLLWFTLPEPKGKPWDVYLAEPWLIDDAKNDGGEYDGLTLEDTRTVYVSAALPRSEQDEVLLHELMHVAYTGNGRLSLTAEELAVSILSPKLIPILKSVGRLRWPTRPAGATAFERRCRRQVRK